MSPTRSRSVQPFPKMEAAGMGMRLGRTPRAATFHHLLNLLHKRGPIRAFERVFPSLAPQRCAALAPSAPAFAFQTGDFLGCLAGGIALLLLVEISYSLPSTGDFSITAVADVAAAALTVGLPESREPALAVLALDRLAGVEQICLLITQDSSMTLQALTAVGKRIDGQAGAVYTFISNTRVIGPLVTEGPRPSFLTLAGEA